MTNYKSGMVAAALSAALAMLVPAVSQAAASTWTFSKGKCNASVAGASAAAYVLAGGTSNCDNKGTGSAARDYVASYGTGGDVRVSGWANSGQDVDNPYSYPDDYQILQGTVTQYGGSKGLGVNNQGGTLNPGVAIGAGRRADPGEGVTPRHSVDSAEHHDMVLFDFALEGQSSGHVYTLKELKFGWWKNDLDISVLAWNPDANPIFGNAPDLTQSYLDSCCDSVDTDLAADGWAVVGHFDVRDGSSAKKEKATLQLTTTLESSYWLVSTYSEAFGAGCATCDRGDDKFNILSVKADYTSGPLGLAAPGAIAPDPPTWLLLAMGIPLMLRVRKR